MPIDITGEFQPSDGIHGFDLYDPQDIKAGNVNVTLTLTAGGRLSSNGVIGEVVMQTGSGAPSHSATEGVLYWDTTNNRLYANNNGSTGWTSLSGDSDQSILSSRMFSGSHRLHTHHASDLVFGLVPTPRLASGTADSSTFLRGDQTWATPVAGSSFDPISNAMFAGPSRDPGLGLGKHILQTANPLFPAAQSLGALSTGLLKNATTTGVLSIGVAGTDYEAALTKGDMTATSPVLVSATRQVIGGAVTLSLDSSSLGLMNRMFGDHPSSVGLAKHILQTPNPLLPLAQSLGSLSTGLLKNTTSTGVLSIGSAGTDYLAPGSDHGLLGGLTDDDHTIYLLASGTRNLTGPLLVTSTNAIGFSAAGNKIFAPTATTVRVVGIDASELGDPDSTADITIGHASTPLAFKPIFNAGVHLGDSSFKFASARIDNLLLDGNTLSSTDTNGNIVLDPNGTGKVVVDGLTISAESGDQIIRTTSGDMGFIPLDGNVVDFVVGSSAYVRVNGGPLVTALTGGGTGNYYVGGIFDNDFATVNSATGAETDLYSVAVDTAALADGDGVGLKVDGTFAGNANAKNIRVYFGTTLLYQTTGLLFNGVSWHVEVFMVRTSSTAQRVSIQFSSGSALLNYTTIYTTGAEATGSKNFKVNTPATTANNDVVKTMGRAYGEPAR